LDTATLSTSTIYISKRLWRLLQYAIWQSGCDKYAKEHFCHSADGYKFEGDYEAFMQELEQWYLEEVESITSTSTSTNTIRDYQWLQFDVLEYIKVLALNTSRNSGAGD
jgi:hypothetical protein